MANEPRNSGTRRPSSASGKTLVGVVTSAKMQKTIVVKVTRTMAHPLYHRVMRKTKKYYAHDEKGEARMGDTVRMVASTAAVATEALAAGGNCAALAARELRRREGEETRHGSDEDVADRGR